MLKAVPRSFWSSSWRVLRDAEEVCQVTMGLGREGATATVGHQLFEIERESWGEGDWLLRAGDEVILRARKPSAWRSRLEIDVDHDLVRLMPSGLGGKSYLVTNRDGAIFGRIERRSWWKRRTSLDLPEDLPLPAQVFFFVMVLLMWNRCGAAWVGN